MTTYRIDPVDDAGQPRDLTLDEISKLMRAQYAKIPALQWAMFTAVHPELAYLFQSNGD